MRGVQGLRLGNLKEWPQTAMMVLQEGAGLGGSIRSQELSLGPAEFNLPIRHLSRFQTLDIGF